jgi:hypothetical protein
MDEVQRTAAEDVSLQEYPKHFLFLMKEKNMESMPHLPLAPCCARLADPSFSSAV